MASDEEVFRYVLKVENEEKLKTAAAAAALAEQKFQALYASLGAGAAPTRAAAASLVDLNKQLEAGKAANRDLGRATLEASRGLEDLQYGVAGVLNNLPSLIASLGGSAGLAGVVSLVAVGGKVLYDHWDDLAGLFGQGSTKTEAERMEELGKKTEKTADETARLLKYEEGRKHLEAQGQKPEAATKFGQAVDKAVAEGPLDAIDKGLDKHFGDRIRGMAAGDPRFAGRDAAADEQIASHREAIRVARMNNNEELAAIVEPQLNLAIEKKNAVYGEARQAFRGELATNPDRVKRVAAAARANPRDFGPEGEKFAASLDAAGDPGAAGRAKILDAFGKVVDKIVEKFPKLAEDAQKKIDEASMEELGREMAGEESGRQTEKFLKNLRKERAEKADKDAAEEDDQAMAGEAAGLETDKFLKGIRRERAEKQSEKATAGTGFDARGEQAMLRSMLAGGSREQVTGRVAGGIAGELQAGGVERREAERIAKEKAEALYGKVGDEVHAKAMEGPERRPVERIGVGDFARSVEAGGTKKLETLTEQMKDYLSTVARNSDNFNKIAR